MRFSVQKRHKRSFLSVCFTVCLSRLHGHGVVSFCKIIMHNRGFICPESKGFDLEFSKLTFRTLSEGSNVLKTRHFSEELDRIRRNSVNDTEHSEPNGTAA